MNHAHNIIPTPSAFAGAAGMRAGGGWPEHRLPRMAPRTASLPNCRGVSR